MSNYTAAEYTDMIIMYGRAGESARAAAELYAQQYPERERHPTYGVILRCIQRLRETGSVLRNCRNIIGPIRYHARIEERILEIFRNNPQRSLRQVAHLIGVSANTVHRVLRRNGLRPFHYRRVQNLLDGDYQQRVNFCKGLLAQHRRDRNFVSTILWTDEATFTPNGIFNSRNFLIWGEENPHAIRTTHFQHRWTINVWAGIIGDKVIGPYFLPSRLSGEIYLRFLRTALPNLMEEIPLQRRREMIFQHDGAPAHFSRQVRDFLNEFYGDRWIGRGGPILWPARSPDLNVLDYFMWGHIKSLVEHRHGGTETEMRESIVQAFRTITPDLAYSATHNIIGRAELCLRAQGQHFE